MDICVTLKQARHYKSYIFNFLCASQSLFPPAMGWVAAPARDLAIKPGVSDPRNAVEGGARSWRPLPYSLKRNPCFFFTPVSVSHFQVSTEMD
jgi:hypothetical protein